MGHAVVSVEQPAATPSHERTEDRLEPELFGDECEPDQEQERAPHTNLCGRVLEP